MKDLNEDLFLQSLDGNISDEQKNKLNEAMTDLALRKNADQFLKLRSNLLRKEVDSFGPFFAERIINQIKSLKKEIDYQIFFFFKKYQVAAIGVVVALMVLNIFLSDNLTFKSVLGFEDEQVDNIVSIDLYQNLTE
ncbi:MAG TPA: hypothetical protein VGQ59_09520 [Cyclobacteriaceae bacterium]|jgi:hypothetical protein|nr:hypothetical protein [Cyclobacteriaceae bacterium]